MLTREKKRAANTVLLVEKAGGGGAIIPDMSVKHPGLVHSTVISAYEPGAVQTQAWLGLSLESLTQPIQSYQEGTFVTVVPESQALMLLSFNIY